MTLLHALIAALIVCALLMRRMARLERERDTYRHESDKYRLSTYHLEGEVRKMKARNFVLNRELTSARWLIDEDLNRMMRAER